MKIKGWRKALFGVAALMFLSGGYGFCAWKPEVLVGFGAYATAVVSICGLVVAGNVGEHAVAPREPKP